MLPFYCRNSVVLKGVPVLLRRGICKPVMKELKTIWKKADAVCFDIDSTVVKDEALDELAEFCDAGKLVKEWTIKAMGGGVSFRTSLQERLKIFEPSREKLAAFVDHHEVLLSPGVKELITLLQGRGTAVYLVTGGFLTIAEPIAKAVSVPVDNIFANKFKFYFNGEFAGFDENQPTSDSGGKAKVCQLLKDKYQYKTIVMIGDGATDMEASPPADLFIGYGGNIVRDKVKAGAHWFVTDFTELINELNGS